jgi:hypothetical protein
MCFSKVPNHTRSKIHTHTHKLEDMLITYRTQDAEELSKELATPKSEIVQVSINRDDDTYTKHSFSWKPVSPDDHAEMDEDVVRASSPYPEVRSSTTRMYASLPPTLL